MKTKSKANSNSRERLSVSQISGPLGSEISAFENDRGFSLRSAGWSQKLYNASMSILPFRDRYLSPLFLQVNCFVFFEKKKNEYRTSLDKLSHLLFWFLYFYIQLKAETKIFESGHRVKLICWINAKKCSWRIKVWITWTWRDEGQKLYSPRYLNHDQQNACRNEQTELKNALKCAFI